MTGSDGEPWSDRKKMKHTWKLIRFWCPRKETKAGEQFLGELCFRIQVQIDDELVQEDHFIFVSFVVTLSHPLGR